MKQLPKHNIQKQSQDKHFGKKSTIQTLLDEYNKQPRKVVEDKQPVKVVEDKQDKHFEKKSIIQNLLDEYNKQPIKVVEDKQPVKVVEDSISKKLLENAKASKRQLQNKENYVRYCQK